LDFGFCKGLYVTSRNNLPRSGDSLSVCIDVLLRNPSQIDPEKIHLNGHQPPIEQLTELQSIAQYVELHPNAVNEDWYSTAESQTARAALLNALSISILLEHPDIQRVIELRLRLFDDVAYRARRAAQLDALLEYVA